MAEPLDYAVPGTPPASYGPTFLCERVPALVRPRLIANRRGLRIVPAAAGRLTQTLMIVGIAGVCAFWISQLWQWKGEEQKVGIAASLLLGGTAIYATITSLNAARRHARSTSDWLDYDRYRARVSLPTRSVSLADVAAIERMSDVSRRNVRGEIRLVLRDGTTLGVVRWPDAALTIRLAQELNVPIRDVAFSLGWRPGNWRLSIDNAPQNIS